MAEPSNPELLTLHSLRLKGFIDAAEAAELAGLEPATVEANLATFSEQGLVIHREGRVSGWQLPADGRAAGEAMLAAELDASGARDAVAGAYQRFLESNQSFLSICTDWQVRDIDGEQALNDHTDAGYDAGVIDALSGIDEKVQPIVADLAAALDRFESYGPRFTDRLAKVKSGDTDWFTKPMIDSYHTVWFELHENLLATLGIERAKEGH